MDGETEAGPLVGRGGAALLHFPLELGEPWGLPTLLPSHPTASRPPPPAMLPRRGSAEARSFPKPCLRRLPPFADFIQKQIKEAVEGGGWVGVAPPSPCPCGGWHGGPEGLCVPWDPPGTRLGRGGPAWPGLAMWTKLWIPGQSPRAQRTTSSPRGPGRGLSAWGPQASCCHGPGVPPPLCPTPCPSRSGFLPSAAVSVSLGCRPCLQD